MTYLRTASLCMLLICANADIMFSQQPVNRIVEVEKGRMTLRLQEVPLLEAVEVIRPHFSNIAFEVAPGLQEQLVSIEIVGAGLEEALRVLLSKQDYVLRYSTGNQEKSELTAVWIFGPGEAKAMKPASPEALYSSREIGPSLTDSDPAVRLRGFKILLERPGAEAREAMLGAIRNERDDGVRATMMEGLLSSGSELPLPFLLSLMSDPSEQIRFLGLDALRGTPALRDQATAALADPSPHIRERAQEILNELDLANRPPQ